MIKSSSSKLFKLKKWLTLPETMKQKAAAHGDDALSIMVELMHDTEAPAAVRLSAAQAVLDRGYGKPTQAVEVSGDVSHVDAALLRERYDKNMAKTLEYAKIAEERRRLLLEGTLH